MTKFKVGDWVMYKNTKGDYTVWEITELDYPWFSGVVVKTTTGMDVGISGGSFHIDPVHGETRLIVNRYNTKLGKILYK